MRKVVLPAHTGETPVREDHIRYWKNTDGKWCSTGEVERPNLHSFDMARDREWFMLFPVPPALVGVKIVKRRVHLKDKTLSIFVTD